MGIKGIKMVKSYTEQIKQRIINGDLSKPDILYPALIREMKEAKQKHVMPFLENFSGDTVLDVGGADGYLIKDMNFVNKFVIDKRDFARHQGISYINEYYIGQDYKQDLTIMSEFLHVFSYEDIEEYIEMVKGPLLIIENKYDDFLDLRLRMWSKGRCLSETKMDELIGGDKYDLEEYIAWVK